MSDDQVSQTDSNAFLDIVRRSMSSMAETGESLGLLVVHLENHNRLISAFGYQIGNELVAEVFRELKSQLRPQDRIVRISESKFAIIIAPLRNPGIVVLAANKLSKISARSVKVGPHELSARLRIGIAIAPEQGSDAEILLQKAETALLAAHAEDTDHAIFAPDQHQRASESLRLDIELDRAIKRKEFELHFQPKVSTRDFLPCGAEALIRWNNPERGFVSPDVFIPLADRTGRIEPLTSFVLNASMQQAAQWPRDLDLAINMSPKMLNSPDLIEMVAIALKLWDFSPKRLFVEITEGAIMENPQSSFRVLSGLRDLGVRISIDDFGTGYSSLAYFKNIPADELKIDKSFVQNMLQDTGDKKIVGAIIQLSRQFGLEVTAEGIEDARTARVLAKLGCARLQGYYYAPALPQSKFLEWLQAYRADAESA